MMRSAIVAMAAFVSFGGSLTAGDNKVQKPVGTWTRSTGGVEVKFDFKGDTLKCTLSGMGLMIEVDADYGMSKDGVIFGRISKVDKKGCIGPSVGDLFTFRCRIKGDTLTISDLGPPSMADARELVEGEYTKKK